MTESPKLRSVVDATAVGSDLCPRPAFRVVGYFGNNPQAPLLNVESKS